MNYLFRLSYFLFFLSTLISCIQPTKSKEETLTYYLSNKEDSSLLILDSIQLENFIINHPLIVNQTYILKSFYEKRNYSFAWMTHAGINEQAGNFLNVFNNEKFVQQKDSAFILHRLHELYNLVTEEDYMILEGDSNTLEFELLLTASYFDYAKRNWMGGSDENLREVGWFIERKKINYAELLDSLVSGKNLDEPVYRQYGLLKKYLSKYDSIEKNSEWSEWVTDIKKIKLDDTSYLIPLIKKQLFVLGDISIIDTSNVYDSSLITGIKKFQQRHGIKEDGILGRNTIQMMNTPLHERIQQILINMERCRWVPSQLNGDYIAVNIPAFKLYVYHNSKLEWSCNVVVGKATTKTVIFNSEIEYIVFNPYWNIPLSILKKETLPAIQSNSDYLVTHEMEIINKDGNIINASDIAWNRIKLDEFPYTIRQRPGKNNALGRIKFLFPNSFGIYLHDTPSKSLFGESKRTFSHGCIRIEEPFKLTQFLLREEKQWTTDSIQYMMDNEKQIFIPLKKKVPIFIAYLTAWVDRDGKINFREDIYSHDEKMKKLLFK